MPSRLTPTLRRLAALTAFGLLRAGPAPAQAPRIHEIQIAPPYLRMVQDAQTQVTATAYDTSGMPVNVRFRWSSNNINVAVVSENGMVRAVGAGATLITASLEGERGRRRAAQVTVRVTAPGGHPPGVMVMPEPAVSPNPRLPAPPGAPVAPPTARTPGAPMTMPSAPVTVFSPRVLDSTMKASINCNDPMMNSVNPLNACYDQRPTPRVPPPAPAVSCPDRGNNTVMLMVRVGESGEVVDVMPFARGGCDQLVEAAIAATRAMTFNPALRGGQPLSAWLRLMIRPTPTAIPVPAPAPKPQGPA